MAKRKIVFGKKDMLPPGEFDPKLSKVRISIMLDGDVLDAVKAKAKESNGKYQTLINQTLRNVFVGSRSTEQSDFEKLVEEISKMTVRVEAIEETIEESLPVKKRA